MAYDSITRLISGLENPLVTIIALLIHNDIIFMAAIVALTLLEERGKKRKKVLLSLVVVLLLSLSVKEILMIERPCVQIEAKLECPNGFSFPSVHAAMAFMLAIAFLNRPNYWLYLAFALLVALTRIYLGVHAFEDVAASLAVAAIGYSSMDRIWKWKYGE